MDWVWVTRTALLVTHGANVGLIIAGRPAESNPLAAKQRKLAQQRVGPVLEHLAATLCHFTLWMQIKLVVYLALVLVGAVQKAAMLVVVLMPLQGLVGVLYWTFALYDPWLLIPRDEFPEDQGKADRIVRQFVIGPTNLKHPDMIFIWLMMHLQHTVAPAHLFVEAAYGVLPGNSYSISMATECATTLGVAVAYLMWNFFTWYARGKAAYPIQQLVSRSLGKKILFYGSIAVALILLSVLSTLVRSSQHTTS